MAIYGNGANLTSLPSSAPTSAQVGTATINLGAGAVGTYGFVTQTNKTGQSDAGATASGNLRYGCANGQSNNSLGGTWRSMGYHYQGGTPEKTTLFIRIS